MLPFLYLFAVSDSVLLYSSAILRWVRHNSAARIVSLEIVDSTCEYRHLVTFIFVGAVCDNTLTNCATRVCRACVDEPTYVAVIYLTLRICRDMGAHCAPLRKKKSSAVPLFRSGHMSAICARLSKGKGEIYKRVENRRLSTLLCARRAQRQHSRTPQRAKSSAVGTANPSTAVRRFPSPFRGGFRSVQTVLNDISSGQ